MKRFFLLVLVLLQSGLASAALQRFSVPLDDSPSLGPANAPVTIIEFIDFQ